MSDDYKFNPSTGEFEEKSGWWKNLNLLFSTDKGVGLWGLLFLFFPHIGFLVYFLLKKRRPLQAKSILHWSIAGGILFFIGMLNED